MPRTVSMYMVGDPVFVEEDVVIGQLMEIMNNQGVSHFLVNDLDGKLIGVISKEDILKKLKSILSQSSGKTYSMMLENSVTAKDIMSKNLITVKPTDSLEYSVELLLQKEFHCLPVVKEGSAIGIVTLYDLLKAYYQQYG